MKKIEVELVGTSPLLMHSAENMEAQKATTNPGKVYDPVVDAEKVAYKTKDGYLYVPARCIKASLLNAASWSKIGRKSAKPIIAGCTRLEPQEVLILDEKNKPMKNYEIDKRPVVVQRARIIRSRPRMDNWKLKLKLIYDEAMVGDIQLLHQLFQEAGQRVGLLDNRPQRYGENGSFEVTKFLPCK